MDLKKVLESIKENYNFRASSPIYGFFVFSWIAANWQPLLIIILSKENVYKIIGAISHEYGFRFLEPGIFAVILMLSLPILSSAYIYYVSFFNFLIQDGSYFGRRFKYYYAMKRRHKRVEKIKKHSANLALHEANISNWVYDKTLKDLEAKLLKENIENFPELLNELKLFKEKNAQLEKQNSEVTGLLYRSLSGEEPGPNLLPSNMRPMQKNDKWLELNAKRLKKQSGKL